jgi:PAS domain S-box-containing protein
MRTSRPGDNYYRLLVESVTDYAIFMLDPDGKVATWNKGAFHVKGYEEAEVIGMPYERFFLPEDAAAGKPQRLLQRTLREGHAEDEGWRRRKDGSRFWALAVLTAIYDEAGQLVGFGKVTRDLTERKRAEELAARNLELQLANKLKSELVANMSHELRTPLNSIIGYAELVAADPRVELDTVASKNLEIVLRCSEQLLGLINEVLDLSKLEAGQTRAHVEPFDPRQTLEAAVAVNRPQADEKGLALALHVAPGVELVLGDEAKLRQIVINLVNNAVKYTEHGEVKVSLAPAGDERFQVEVVDTGPGIAPEHQELVFQEFHQVEAKATRKQGGTGLGLAISRRLATLLGGTLALASTPGQGSTFRLELPRQLDYPASPAAPTLPEAAAPLPAPDGRPVLLAIDDEPEVLHLVAENLKDSPYQVVMATSGESGLELARTLRPAVISLDVMMPRMDGWVVLRRLKEDPATAGIPVVMLSFLENRGLAAQLGAAEFLPKPLHRQDLIDALDRARSRGGAR